MTVDEFNERGAGGSRKLSVNVVAMAAKKELWEQRVPLQQLSLLLGF